MAALTLPLAPGSPMWRVTRASRTNSALLLFLVRSRSVPVLHRIIYFLLLFIPWDYSMQPRNVLLLAGRLVWELPRWWLASSECRTRGEILWMPASLLVCPGAWYQYWSAMSWHVPKENLLPIPAFPMVVQTRRLDVEKTSLSPLQNMHYY